MKSSSTLIQRFSSKILGILLGLAVLANSSADTSEEDPHEDIREDRVVIDPLIANKAGIKTARASSGRIRQTITLYGKIAPDSTMVSHIRARFPGVITQVHSQIGDRVEVGQILAKIESNESLQQYPVKSPLAGVITEKHASPGENTQDQVLFTVVNTERLWAELEIFPERANRIIAGQTVLVSADKRRAESTIGKLLPGNAKQPFIIARVAIDNTAGHWTPGLLVEGKAIVNQRSVPLVVDTRALQTFGDSTVVFAKIGNSYQMRPLQLGVSDGKFTEVVSGLKVGDWYVTENSYLIKAELEKSGASHEH